MMRFSAIATLFVVMAIVLGMSARAPRWWWPIGMALAMVAAQAVLVFSA